MAEIITPAQRHSETIYFRIFERRTSPGSGFHFPCSPFGSPLPLSPLAQENYAKCLAGEYDVVDLGVEEDTSYWMEPAVLACDCGGTLPLEGFTNTCGRCEADYNIFGRRLAPRHLWAEGAEEIVRESVLAVEHATEE